MPQSLACWLWGAASSQVCGLFLGVMCVGYFLSVAVLSEPEVMEKVMGSV